MKLGIDIGGTKVCAGLFDDSGKLIEKLAAKTAEISSLADWIADAAEKLSAKHGGIDFCGIGVPGTVSEDGKKIIKVPNAEISENLCAETEKRLGVPCLAVQDSRVGRIHLRSGKRRWSACLRHSRHGNRNRDNH